MAGKSVMLELGDERIGKIAEVLSNKSASKILDVLAEKEMSESEIAELLGMKLNTVEYNVNKLIEAGLIEKHKKVFWSSKGKKMDYYVVVDKKIVISPRKMIRGVVPAVIVSVIGAIGISLFGMGGEKISSVGQDAIVMAESAAVEGIAKSGDGVVSEIAIRAPDYADVGMQVVQSSGGNSWAWFLLGAWISLLVIICWVTWRDKYGK